MPSGRQCLDDPTAGLAAELDHEPRGVAAALKLAVRPVNVAALARVRIYALDVGEHPPKRVVLPAAHAWDRRGGPCRRLVSGAPLHQAPGPVVGQPLPA